MTTTNTTQNQPEGCAPKLEEIALSVGDARHSATLVFEVEPQDRELVECALAKIWNVRVSTLTTHRCAPTE